MHKDYYRTQSPESYLYTTLIRQVVGPVASDVLGLLMAKGRLTVGRLGTILGIPHRKVHAALVTLIQLGCVVYYTEKKPITHWNTNDVDNSKKKSTGQTWYYFHETGLLLLLYGGEMIAVVRREHGPDAATLLQAVITSGHVRLRDLERDDNGLEIHNAARHLIEDDWLIPTGSEGFQGVQDQWDDLYKITQASYHKEHLGQTISDVKRTAQVREETCIAFIKRITESLDHLKMGLVSSDVTSELLPSISKVKRNVALSANFDRFLKHKRTLQLTNMARHRLGAVAGQVYQAALSIVERHTRSPLNTHVTVLLRLVAGSGQSTTTGLSPATIRETLERQRDSDCSPVVTFRPSDVLSRLSHECRRALDSTIWSESFSAVKRPIDSSEPTTRSVHKKIKLEDNCSGSNLLSLVNAARYAEEDSDRMPKLQALLELLAKDSSVPFLAHGDHGTFFVPFTDLAPVIKLQTYKSCIRTVLGAPCLRILNCIIDHKLIDEKMLANKVLMKASEIRTKLAKLIEFQIIEIQEVPKTQDRNALRSVFAFRHRFDLGTNLMLKSLAFNAAQVLESLTALKIDNKILLDKVSRDDVQGKELEFLQPSELKQMELVYQHELRSYGQLSRILASLDALKFCN
ncbi:BA75_02325T0 [Komagataella pastoris]|uniref:DNA-directed RNA polymerase III subunit RPC3 n=1 Tax=Komagataella pastoris TaxID=4922 RepID=A0A1B2JAZ3_PICPA|nr:BA75_02325T0 [Komagataella pastoris]